MRCKGIWILFMLSALGALGGGLSLAALAGVTLKAALLASFLPAAALHSAQQAMGLAPAARGVLYDSAHGPLFLNVVGVTVVYFLPAAVAFIAAWRLRARAGTREP